MPLLDREYQTISDAAQSLTALENLFRQTKDKRGIFVVAYKEMTDTLQKLIDSQEKGSDKIFNDLEWVKGYLVTFANLYREALYGALHHLTVPRAWKISFEKIEDEGILTIQHLMLGINAHIMRDLPFTLNQIGLGNDEQQKFRKEDHDNVNQVLETATDTIQKKVSNYHRAKGLALLDSFLTSFDEWVTNSFFQRQREMAWLDALSLAESGELRGKIEDKAEEYALRISAWQFPKVVAEFFMPDGGEIIEILSPDEKQVALMKSIEGKIQPNEPKMNWDWTQVI
jgi:hypothetical protein